MKLLKLVYCLCSHCVCVSPQCLLTVKLQSVVSQSPLLCTGLSSRSCPAERNPPSIPISSGTFCARPRASFCCMPTACFACLILPTIKLLIATPPRKEKVCSSAARFVFSQRGACEGGWEGVHTNARCPLVLTQRLPWSVARSQDAMTSASRLNHPCGSGARGWAHVLHLLR